MCVPNDSYLLSDMKFFHTTVAFLITNCLYSGGKSLNISALPCLMQACRRAILSLSWYLYFYNFHIIDSACTSEVLQISVDIQGVPRPKMLSYANICNPFCRIFNAAFKSRIWWTPQQGQSHSRTDKSFVFGFFQPQNEHNWLDGKYLSIMWRFLPYHAHLYSNCLRIS